MTARLASVVVPGGTDAWVKLGFTVVDGLVPFANGAVRPDATARTPALSIDDDMAGAQELPADVDGVAVIRGRCTPPADHANGCFELDHVVIVTPSIAVTSAAIERVLGLPQRRIRETSSVRQAFHRFPDRGCIVELVERLDATAPALWGVVVNTVDLGALVSSAGDLVGAPKPAVQAGRSIVTVRSAAGVGCALAFMSV